MSIALEQEPRATIGATTETAVIPAASSPRGVRIDVHELSRRVRVRGRGELALLDAVSFTVAPGELVAIVGPSGAGKTTLLEAIAGIAPATSGSVRFDGVDVHADVGAFRSVLGYVPQDDIIHADLPLRRTLRYAAQLRLPSSASASEVDDAVRDALEAVDLTDQADVRVGSLSGGQRKRASIAAELLTDPHVFFLDEPTSGLDPVTSAELIGRLRLLADQSATVVFTTHSVEDLAQCDRIVFMARGGRVGFVGTVDEAAYPRRQENLGAFHHRRVLPVHHPRRPHRFAHRGRQPGDRQHAHIHLGNAGQPRAALHRARQAHRRHRMDQYARRPAVRYQLRAHEHRHHQWHAPADHRRCRRRRAGHEAADR
jgi:ABC-type multidrug transport system ATPase subunit